MLTDATVASNVKQAVPFFNVTDRPAASFDRIEEIRPELADVLSIGLVELRVLMQHRITLVRGIKRPTVAPAGSLPETHARE